MKYLPFLLLIKTFFFLQYYDNIKKINIKNINTHINYSATAIDLIYKQNFHVKFEQKELYLHTLGSIIYEQSMLKDLGLSQIENNSVLAGFRSSIIDGVEMPNNLSDFVVSMSNYFKNCSSEYRLSSIEDNKISELCYLYKLSHNSDFQKTDSGIYYSIIINGNGIRPQNTDIIKVCYIGSLLNGKVFTRFTSSRQFVNFKLDSVIAGFLEGVKLISEGGRIEVCIPSCLAYGYFNNEILNLGSALVFDIKLFEVISDCLFDLRK